MLYADLHYISVALGSGAEQTLASSVDWSSGKEEGGGVESLSLPDVVVMAPSGGECSLLLQDCTVYMYMYILESLICYEDDTDVHVQASTCTCKCTCMYGHNYTCM